MMMLSVKGGPDGQYGPLSTIQQVVALLITIGNLAQTSLSVYALILLVQMHLPH
ncbi:MAG: hypothetical protein ACLQUY_26160 [Ktedonobacterales bacterium]